MVFLKVVGFLFGSGWVESSDRGRRTRPCARPLQLVRWPTTIDQHVGLQNRTILHVPIGYMPLCTQVGSSRRICPSCLPLWACYSVLRLERPMDFAVTVIVNRRLLRRLPWRRTL